MDYTWIVYSNSSVQSVQTGSTCARTSKGNSNATRRSIAVFTTSPGRDHCVSKKDPRETQRTKALTHSDSTLANIGWKKMSEASNIFRLLGIGKLDILRHASDGKGAAFIVIISEIVMIHLVGCVNDGSLVGWYVDWLVEASTKRPQVSTHVDPTGHMPPGNIRKVSKLQAMLQWLGCWKTCFGSGKSNLVVCIGQ